MKRIVLAIVGAGIAGTIANAVAAGLILGSDRFSLMLVPGRYAVAIACALVLPLAYRTLTRPLCDVTALLALTVIPSLLAKLVFGAAAPWPTVLALNAVYAVAAWAVYRLLDPHVPARSHA